MRVAGVLGYGTRAHGCILVDASWYWAGYPLVVPSQATVGEERARPCAHGEVKRHKMSQDIIPRERTRRHAEGTHHDIMREGARDIKRAHRRL